MDASKKTKVAILGGGVGAMAAAWELTSTPERRAKYDVTVHQLGWRLGGKGASGRNAAEGQRIEEHGLHIWMGFYENAFRVMRACYEELGRPPTVRDIEERRGRMASKSLIWHTFGSLAAALKEAGFDVPVGEERLERAIADGAVLARELGHLPKMAEWKEARARDATLLSEWQVYRLVDVNPGAWSAFQFLVSQRLREEGVEVLADGTVEAP